MSTFKKEDLKVGDSVRTNVNKEGCPIWKNYPTVTGEATFIVIGIYSLEFVLISNPNSNWSLSSCHTEFTDLIDQISDIQKYLNTKCSVISTAIIISIVSADSSTINNGSSGRACERCKDYNAYGEPNMPDGKTFMCYQCKQDPYR